MLFNTMHTNRGFNVIVQIYEIQTVPEARAMTDLGVDHIGSVVTSAEQWQNPELKKAIDVVRKAGRKSSLIPLFTDIDTIKKCVDFYGPDILHFCEALPMDPQANDAFAAILARQVEIRRCFPRLEIMRSIPIAMKGAKTRTTPLALLKLFEPVSDWFLTDTLLIADPHEDSRTKQPVAGYVGITGKTCNWQTARELVETTRIPVILAGGIGPENVREGIRQTRPAGVDSCTRTNAVDLNGRPVRFKKDPLKVKKMIEAVRLELAENNFRKMG